MNALNQLLGTLKLEANVFHNGQYCGLWAVDTSGTSKVAFHVVSYGCCYLMVDQQTFRLNAGDAIFFPTDISHRISNLSNSDLPLNECISLPMTGELQQDATGLVCGYLGYQHPLFDKLLKQLPEWLIVRGDQGLTSTSVIDLMVKESLRSGQSTSFLLDRLSECLFYALLRDHVDMQSGLFSALVHPKLSKSLALIHDAMDRRLSLDELAECAGMSRSAFSGLFKDVVGQSPVEYITQWRMAQAYRWLVDEGLSTSTVAIRCGYESESSFSKAFKRVIGMGPGQARAGFKGE